MTPDLEALEAVIEADRTAYTTVGIALAQIRDRKLHKQTSFETYCVERWGLKGRRGNQFIVSAKAAADLNEAGLPVPAVEFQARTVAFLPQPIRHQVWMRTWETTGGRPTVMAIQAARRAVENEAAAEAYEAATGQPAKTVRRAPQRTQQRAIAAGISTLQGLCAGLAQITDIDDSINAEEAAQWVRDLSEPLRVLRGLTNKLKEHSHGNHR